MRITSEKKSITSKPKGIAVKLHTALKGKSYKEITALLNRNKSTIYYIVRKCNRNRNIANESQSRRNTLTPWTEMHWNCHQSLLQFLLKKYLYIYYAKIFSEKTISIVEFYERRTLARNINCCSNNFITVFAIILGVHNSHYCAYVHIWLMNYIISYHAARIILLLTVIIRLRSFTHW